jgi:hypothetical protein
LAALGAAHDRREGRIHGLEVLVSGVVGDHDDLVVEGWVDGHDFAAGLSHVGLGIAGPKHQTRCSRQPAGLEVRSDQLARGQDAVGSDVQPEVLVAPGGGRVQATGVVGHDQIVVAAIVEVRNELGGAGQRSGSIDQDAEGIEEHGSVELEKLRDRGRLGSRCHQLMR